MTARIAPSAAARKPLNQPSAAVLPLYVWLFRSVWWSKSARTSVVWAFNAAASAAGSDTRCVGPPFVEITPFGPGAGSTVTS